MPAELINIFAPVPTTKRGSANVIGYSAKHGTILYAVGRAIVIRNIKVSSDGDSASIVDGREVRTYFGVYIYIYL